MIHAEYRDGESRAGDCRIATKKVRALWSWGIGVAARGSGIRWEASSGFGGIAWVALHVQKALIAFRRPTNLAQLYRAAALFEPAALSLQNRQRFVDEIALVLRYLSRRRHLIHHLR